MSGIGGIVNLDRAPVDRDLLDRMSSFLAQWGPDANDIWAQGSVGLVHTLLKATPESERERQPASLDGNVWITADARLDAREDLIAELRGQDRRCSVDSIEPELILHAYAAWGEACVEHLLGDFAFAIWDGSNQKLFCARDHFGVKSFFYAHVDGALIFSNAIDAPRLHPDVPHELYEPAIADFLILGYNHDVERTPIEAVRRLAPAHVLIARDGEVRTRRYWTLPLDPPTIFRRSHEYVERFIDLFGQAVRDRLRTTRAAVLMSGGMDSCSVAAVAKKILSDQGNSFELSAHTAVYEKLIPYNEGRYASLAAKALGIPWHRLPLDNQELLALWDSPEIRSPEPEQMLLFPRKLADLLGNPQPGLVVLTGQGSDGLFSSLRKRHCRELVRQRRWGQLASDVGRHLLSEGRFGRLYLKHHLLRRLGRGTPRRPFPAWLNPKLDRRLDLQSRYEKYEMAAVGISSPKEAVRPEAYEIMGLPVWPSIFEEYAPGYAGTPLEVRHPYFDLRLVRYVLSLPALPWCADKELLRRSMRGLLPDDVRLRRKEAVLADYLFAHFHNNPKPWLESLEPLPELHKFVDLDVAKECLRNLREWETCVHLRPFCLNFWLKWESQFAYKVGKEDSRVKIHQGAVS